MVILDCGTSDHKPILIHPRGVPVRQNKPWRFEKMWLEEEGCHDMVSSAWREGKGSTPVCGVMNKVGKCQVKLKWWSKHCFKNVTWEIAEKQKRMREAEASIVQGINVDLVAKLKGELVGLIAKEQMWQQRSKIHWLKSSDKNSKFFHSKASQSLGEIVLWGLRILMGFGV